MLDATELLSGLCHLPARLVLRTTFCARTVTEAEFMLGGSRENDWMTPSFNIISGGPAKELKREELKFIISLLITLYIAIPCKRLTVIRVRLFQSYFLKKKWNKAERFQHWKKAELSICVCRKNSVSFVKYRIQT